MNLFDHISSHSSFRSLGPSFWEEVEPEPLQGSVLLDLNPLGVELLGLTSWEEKGQSKENREQWRALHNGEVFLGGQKPICSYYSGHQFGVWAGRLGDGRAHILGEVNGYELQLKGSGLTPFSRMGDGRAVLRSTIREYLAGEYLHALGIPTTRSLGIVAGEDPVWRETMERGAMMIRLSPSFIRFGTFEHFQSTGQARELGQLLEFVMNRFYPECASASDQHERKAEAFFLALTERTAHLMAQWMAYGFCHGVMNTDNMSILGLTLDYGPYGFLEGLDVGHVCNHSDTYGRYSYRNQPAVAQWNLLALAHSLQHHLSPEKARKIVEEGFSVAFDAKYWALLCQRFGLPIEERSGELINQALRFLQQHQEIDYNLFQLFLSSSGDKDLPQGLQKLGDKINRIPAWKDWFTEYGSSTSIELQSAAKKINPRYVLKNWVAQEAISRTDQDGNGSFLAKVRHVLQFPFAGVEGNAEDNELEYLQGETPAWGKCMEISCSS